MGEGFGTQAEACQDLYLLQWTSAVAWKESYLPPPRVQSWIDRQELSLEEWYRRTFSWGHTNPHSFRLSTPAIQFHVRKHCVILPSCRNLFIDVHFCFYSLGSVEGNAERHISSASLKLLLETLSSLPFFMIWSCVCVCVCVCIRSLHQRKSLSWWTDFLLASDQENCAVTTDLLSLFLVLVVRKLTANGESAFHLLIYLLFL